jgi:hypothetical protein
MFNKEEQLIQEFIRLLTESNNTILTGYAASAGTGVIIPVKIGNTTQFAYSINVVNPGKVNLVYSAADKKWIAYQITNTTTTRNTLISYRKNRLRNPITGYPLCKEYYDINNVFADKLFKFGLSFEDDISKKPQGILNTIGRIPIKYTFIQNVKETVGTLVEGKDYLVVYGGEIFNSRFIDDEGKVQPIEEIVKKTSQNILLVILLLLY